MVYIFIFDRAQLHCEILPQELHFAALWISDKSI